LDKAIANLINIILMINPMWDLKTKEVIIKSRWGNLSKHCGLNKANLLLKYG